MTATLSSNALGFTEEFSPPEHLEEQLDILASYDLWFVVERLRIKELLPEERIAPAIFEFRRFIAIRVLGHSGLNVPSQEVDEVWHAFILFTKDYTEFCKRVCGTFIHHVPHTSRDKKDEKCAIYCRSKCITHPSETPQSYSEIYTRYFGILMQGKAAGCWCCWNVPDTGDAVAVRPCSCHGLGNDDNKGGGLGCG